MFWHSGRQRASRRSWKRESSMRTRSRFSVRNANAALADSNSFSGAESTLRAPRRRAAHNGRSQSQFSSRHRFPRLLSAARANAFDIRIRQVELAQQGFKVALSKNERFPAIAVGPFYSMENAIDREQRVGLGISLPLPLWDRNAGNIATSKARQQQAEASLAHDATRSRTTRYTKRRDAGSKARRDRQMEDGRDWRNFAKRRK